MKQDGSIFLGAGCPENRSKLVQNTVNYSASGKKRRSQFELGIFEKGEE